MPVEVGSLKKTHQLILLRSMRQELQKSQLGASPCRVGKSVSGVSWWLLRWRHLVAPQVVSLTCWSLAEDGCVAGLHGPSPSTVISRPLHPVFPVGCGLLLRSLELCGPEREAPDLLKGLAWNGIVFLLPSFCWPKQS